MAAPAILKIDIIADATKAARALDQTGKAAQGTGSKLGGLGKVVAGAFAGGAVLAFGKSALSAATDSEKATHRLEAVFRAMGDTTGTAAKAAEDYASALSAKIGVDDDSIKAAQAQLATFSAVSDATARQAGLFDRTTAAAADLAAAGFGSLEGNAVQLGKAMQDPIKGLAALGKSGVTFTDSQKEQIRVLIESGRQLEAQKIVLGAVEGQVKGTAAATATSQEKMAVAFGETQEAVGGLLLPVLEKLAPILLEVAKFVQENVNWLGPLAAGIGIVVAAQWAWNAAAAANPLTLIVLAIAAVIAGIVLLVKNWDKVTRAFRAAFDWIRGNWPLLLGILTGPIGLAVVWIVKNWDRVRDAFAAVWDFVKRTAGDLEDAITAPYRAAWQLISSIFDKVRGAVEGALNFARSTASKIADAIKGPLNAVIRAWNGLEFKVPAVNVGPVHFGGQTIGLPDIPQLASGGSVLRSGLAVVHAGERWSGVNGQAWSGGDTIVNVQITTTGLGADAPQIQRQVVAALRKYASRNGSLSIPLQRAG